MPISIPPTNTTPGTAFVLNGNVPLDGTIDLRALSNPQKVWFKFTITGLEFGFSAWATFENSKFRPMLRFYTDPFGTDFKHDDSEFGPVEAFTQSAFAVPTIGDVYISLENGYIGSTFIPTTVTKIYINVSSNSALPAGSLIVSNDGVGDPASLVNPTGNPSQIRPIVAGERAAVLENGISLFGSQTTEPNKLYLYDANLTLITIVTYDRGGSSAVQAPISSDRHNTFYVATKSEAPGNITTISDAGVILNTWTVTNLTYTWVNFFHIQPSWLNSDIILVHAGFNPFVSGWNGIARFHKSTQVLDPIYFDATDASWNWQGFFGDEFLTLPNDSTLLMFRAFDDTSGSQVRLFDNTGVLVRTFTISDGDVNHIAYDGAGYTTFWAWSFRYSDFASNFRQFRISDGAVLQNFTLNTTSGTTAFTEIQPTSPTDNQMYGTPESCPFITTAVPLLRYGETEPPPADASGIYMQDTRTSTGGPLPPTVARTNDKLFTSDSSTVEVKIPDPFAIIYPAGD